MARVVASLKDIPLTHHFAEDRTLSSTRPWIVITHHFGGSSTSSLRHVKALSALGFDSVTFDFSWHGTSPRHPFLFRALDMWTRDINQVLWQVLGQNGKERPIIFLSFSGPSASALQAIHQNLENKKYDIRGIICDSGPFVDPKSCTRLMLEEVYGFKNPVTREIALNAMMFLWGSDADARLGATLNGIARLEPEFPILSIRGIKDSIVPIDNIRRAFEGKKLKNLEVLDIESGHLTGLKEQPEVYRNALKKFLERWS